MSGSLLTQDAKTLRRHAAERRFRAYGLTAVCLAMAALVWLLVSIFSQGLPAFRQTFVTFPVTLDAETLDKAGNRNPEEMAKITAIAYGKQMAKAFGAEIAARGIDSGGLTQKDLAAMLSEESAAALRRMVLADPGLIGQTIE